MTILVCWLFACSIVIPHGDPTTYDAPEPYIGRPVPAHTIPNVIAAASRIYGVDPDVMTRLAFCESGLRPDAANPSSTARGLFQHLSSTWTANVARMGAPYTLADRLDPAASSMVAAWMISTGGMGPWEASRACWAR